MNKPIDLTKPHKYQEEAYGLCLCGLPEGGPLHIQPKQTKRVRKELDLVHCKECGIGFLSDLESIFCPNCTPKSFKLREEFLKNRNTVADIWQTNHNPEIGLLEEILKELQYMNNKK